MDTLCEFYLGLGLAIGLGLIQMSWTQQSPPLAHWRIIRCLQVVHPDRFWSSSPIRSARQHLRYIALINRLLYFPPTCMYLYTKVFAPSHRGPLHPPLGCLTLPTGVRDKVHHFASCYGSISPPLCVQLERSPPLIKSRAKRTHFGVTAPVAIQLFKIDLVSFL
ncbi:hypothetical protein Acr_22g0002250 [Actinidia rufa]|uniref:Uncharacterized protein n=1 Tax=Actinidia rufa TaxID=165716 RepID=A0A7J0GJ37_9ERIC|nr:hypothetical protein Acr_22g0002250 [Actinidia rufa]